MGYIMALAFLIVSIVYKNSLDPSYFLIAAGLFSISGSLSYIGSRLDKKS